MAHKSLNASLIPIQSFMQFFFNPRVTKFSHISRDIISTNSMLSRMWKTVVMPGIQPKIRAYKYPIVVIIDAIPEMVLKDRRRRQHADDDNDAKHMWLTYKNKSLELKRSLCADCKLCRIPFRLPDPLRAGMMMRPFRSFRNYIERTLEMLVN